MGSADGAELAATEPEAPEPDTSPSRGRLRRTFAGSREAIRIVYRDPEHVSERLTLYAVAARRPDATSLVIAMAVVSSRR